MDTIKKNLLSIICGIVALLAIGAIFYPIGGMYDQLQALLNQSAKVGGDLDAITNAKRMMPQLTPDKDAQPLQGFPVREVIDAGEIATKKVNSESIAMFKAAVEANRHLLFTPNSVPRPDETTKYKFATDFPLAVADYARWRNILNAGQRPSAAEIDAATKELDDSIDKSIVTAGDTDSQKEADNEKARQNVGVKPRLQSMRAQTYSVYLENGALSFDNTIGVGAGHQIPGPDKIWDAQLAMWILDDVTSAIARANKLYSDPATPGGEPQNDILHAPIKQIEKIDNPVYVPGSTTGASAGETAAVPTLPAASVTGRVSNGLYDTVKFNIVLEVDATKIPIILRELEVNQFITVLNVQLTVVDSAIAASNGFIYGDKPIARLEIQCEELLLHQWVNDLIPDSRKGIAGKGTDYGPGGPGIPGIPAMPGRDNGD